MTKKEKFIEFVNELMELAEFNEWHGSWKEDYKDAIDFFEELTNNLNDCELYSLLIPCKMCREVIKEVRIKKVHYILDNDKEINDNTKFYKIDVDSSLNKELSNKITSFFRKKR